MLDGYVCTVFGLVCFLEGLPYLASPGQARRCLQWLLAAPDSTLRLIGGALMVMGLLLVYWGRGHGG